MRIRTLLLFALTLFYLELTGQAQAFQVNKILDNGPDGEKLVFAIVGDGYAAGDQAKFTYDVTRLVLDGVLAHDFYQENRTAFNIYTVAAVSKDSGVSKPNAEKDTVLKTVYTGQWKRCWIEESGNTEKLLNNALSSVPKYDFVLIIENEGGFGGCRRGSRLYITAGVGWDVVAHEYGHGIGGLFDEYSVPSLPFYDGRFGLPLNVRNCSTVLSRSQVIWSQQITDSTLSIPPPTVFGGTMDSNETVGMFEGCGTFTRGIYRPVDDCRMKSNAPHFCPVCLALMRRAVAPFLAQHAGPSSSPSISAQLFSGVFHNISFSTASLTSQNPPQASDSYLQIVLRVKRSGGSEVIKVTEVSGKLNASLDAGSATALEVTNDNQVVGATFLPDDPFTIRGFPDPANPQGEFFKEADSATIIVKAPKIDIEAVALGDSSLRLFKVQVANSNRAAFATGADEMSFLRQLKSQGLVKEQVKVGEEKLKKAVTDKNKTNSIQ